MKQKTNKKDLKKLKIIQELRDLKRLLKSCKNNKVIATVKHVSKSGMSRIISFSIQDKKTGFLYSLNYSFSKILGYTLTNDGLRVGGCGMNMIFHCLYCVNSSAFYNKVIRVTKNKTRHDLLYSGLVDTSYNYL